MSDILDDVLNGPTEKPEPKVETPEIVDPPEKVETPEPDGAEPEEGAPTAQENTGRNVPLAALEAVRKEKTDWKEKAVRAEAQLEELRRVQAQPRAPQETQQPSEPQDPIEVMQRRLINTEFNLSERLVRREFTDVDDVVAVFTAEADKNPAYYASMHSSGDPWRYAYEQGKRMKAAAEIGDDPAAYRTKLEAELRAKWDAEKSADPATPATASPRAPLPTSLAGARSSASRAAPAFTGPTPFENIIG